MLGDVGILFDIIWVHNFCHGLTNQSMWHRSQATPSCGGDEGQTCCEHQWLTLPVHHSGWADAGPTRWSRFAVAIRETSSWWLPARTMLMSCSPLPEDNGSLVRLLARSQPQTPITSTARICQVKEMHHAARSWNSCTKWWTFSRPGFGTGPEYPD